MQSHTAQTVPCSLDDWLTVHRSITLMHKVLYLLYINK